MSKRSDTEILGCFLKQLKHNAQITIEDETHQGYFAKKERLKNWLLESPNIYEKIKNRKITKITWDGYFKYYGYGIIIEIEKDIK